jgi:hypothetical protein
MVLGYDYEECTFTCAVDTSTVTFTIKSNYSDYEDYDYKREEIEDIRYGWYNPRKININNRHIHKQYKSKARNQLPRKFRRPDNPYL